MIILKTKHLKNIIIIFLSSRGWRIQWSIVPEVSEPMVGWLCASVCQQEHTGSGGRHVVPFIHLFVLLGASKGRLDRVWEVPARAWRGPESAGTTQLLNQYPHNGETALVRVVIELLFSYRTCLGRWQTCWRRSKSKWKESPYWVINCGFIKWGIDKCLFVCVRVHVSLFMWVQPESTRKLYICLWVAFISSCVLPYQLMGFMIGEGRTQHAQTELLYPYDVLLGLEECIYLQAIQRAQTNAFMHHLCKCSVSVWGAAAGRWYLPGLNAPGRYFRRN